MSRITINWLSLVNCVEMCPYTELHFAFLSIYLVCVCMKLSPGITARCRLPHCQILGMRGKRMASNYEEEQQRSTCWNVSIDAMETGEWRTTKTFLTILMLAGNKFIKFVNTIQAFGLISTLGQFRPFVCICLSMMFPYTIIDFCVTKWTIISFFGCQILI